MSTQDQQIANLDPKIQSELNTPLRLDSAISAKDQEFLAMLMEFIASEKINLYRPESLLNSQVYDKLGREAQGKVDIEAVNMLAAIRAIKDLHDAGFGNTYQTQNLVYRLRVSKERLEEIGGNLFII